MTKGKQHKTKGADMSAIQAHGKVHDDRTRERVSGEACVRYFTAKGAGDWRLVERLGPPELATALRNRKPGVRSMCGAGGARIIRRAHNNNNGKIITAPYTPRGRSLFARLDTHGCIIRLHTQ